MSQPQSSFRVRVPQAPIACNLIEGSLDHYADSRRAAREEQVRREGFMDATQTAALALEKAAEKLIACQGDLEASAVLLAVDIAQELLRKELIAGNYDIVAIVRSVLSCHTGATGSTVLRVHPEDAQALSEVRFRTGTEIQADPGIRRGDVHLETDQGVLVRDIDECVAAIRVKLAEATS